MNKEKVFIEGYEVGFLVETTGAREKKIQVASGEIVSIDERFIYKSIEREKVKIPQFVADWIEEARKTCKDIADFFDFDFTNEEVGKWFMQEQAFDLVARAWLDGYEVEEERRYLVRIKGVEEDNAFLNYYAPRNEWFMDSSCDMKDIRAFHTRKELEEANFGWVFSCEGIEVEEVDLCH